jgi:curved DNA-binding protein
VTIPVPPGIESGSRLVLPGRGHAGAGGGASGHLNIIVEVAPHPVFRREGRDVVLTVPVAVHEAGLGAAIEVPSPHGPVGVAIPAGSSSGDRVRVPGYGVGSRDAEPDRAGDLVLELQVVMPRELDEAARALLAEFGRRHPISPRDGRFESQP